MRCPTKYVGLDVHQAIMLAHLQARALERAGEGHTKRAAVAPRRPHASQIRSGGWVGTYATVRQNRQLYLRTHITGPPNGISRSTRSVLRRLRCMSLSGAWLYYCSPSVIALISIGLATVHGYTLG